MHKILSLTDIFDRLLARYGDPHWWPAQTPYEVIAGAVLTQNAAWTNVEKALANFGGGLEPEYVMSLTPEALAEIIHPAGFFNQKAGYLQTVTYKKRRLSSDGVIVFGAIL